MQVPERDDHTLVKGSSRMVEQRVLLSLALRESDSEMTMMIIHSIMGVLKFV